MLSIVDFSFNQNLNRSIVERVAISVANVSYTAVMTQEELLKMNMNLPTSSHKTTG